LVSESFARTFEETLRSKKGLITGPLGESVDMVRFKQMMHSGELDIEPLRQCLKQEI
jgi:hypothetical protein